MSKPYRPFDNRSLAVILVTLALFVAALVTKGFTHDLFLEAGVFLVSVKLILLAYDNGVTAAEMRRELAEIRALLQSQSATSGS